MTNSAIYCPKCMSFNMTIKRSDSKHDKLVCNACGWDDWLLNKEQAIDMMRVLNGERPSPTSDLIVNGKVLCPWCGSENLSINTFSDQSADINCNECSFNRAISTREVEEIHDVVARRRKEMNKESFISSVGPVMEAVIRYDSVETVCPMTLGILRDVVLEAIEKGMPLESEVFNSGSEEAIEGVRFLFKTDKIGPIECGEHKGFFPVDILISTHECEVDNDASV